MLRCVFAVLLALCLGVPTDAALREFHFAGSVGTVSTPFTPPYSFVSVGDAWTMCVVVDPASPDLDPATGVGRYSAQSIIVKVDGNPYILEGATLEISDQFDFGGGVTVDSIIARGTLPGESGSGGEPLSNVRVALVYPNSAFSGTAIPATIDLVNALKPLFVFSRSGGTGSADGLVSVAVTSDLVGACCLSSGNCIELSQECCETLSIPGLPGPGIFRGAGTTCSQVTCTGACCITAFDSGSGTTISQCVDGVAEQFCTFFGGDDGRRSHFFGYGSTCASVSCDGACCLTDGTCQILDQATCESISGAHFGGVTSTCATVSCTGACCLAGGGCVDLSRDACLALSGSEFGGIGTSCATYDCSFGACCFGSGNCADIRQAACANSPGAIFLGVGTRCATSECPGACCLSDGTCQDLSQTQCASLSGSVFNGVGTRCATTNNCGGACCLTNGSCIDNQTLAQCSGLNGTFGGTRVACSTVNCLGACCLSDGTCTPLSQNACAASAGSSFGGIGSSCASVNCTGACCIAVNGTCIGGQTLSSCTGLGGVFRGPQSDCASQSCGGACCLANGTCSENQTLASCGSLGGVFRGGLTACASEGCAWACCLPNGTCQATTLAICTSLGGRYSGLQECATVNCAWSCCMPGVGGCTDSTLATCNSAGGIYTPLVKCSERTDGCPGSCCLPSTQTPCQDMTATQCASLGGIFGGEGTRCASIVEGCPGACCLPDPGHPCVDTTLDQCLALSGTFSGTGSRCATVECPGACCLQNYPDYSCVFVTETACTSQGGIFHGEAVACAVVNCKPPECVCAWENYEADKANAIVSETNVTVPDSMAADDFTVGCAKVFKTSSFCGVMATNDLPSQNGNVTDKPSGIATFYEDCNGKPGAVIATLTDPQYTILGNAPFGAPGQYKWVRLCFNTNNLSFSGTNAEARFWVSLVGVGDHQPGERYYWATSRTAPDTQIQGVQAQLKSAWVPGFADWRDVDDGNGGCHDLSFEICGDLCDVLCDNRPYGLFGGAKILNSVFFGTKTADDFQIGPCNRADICEVELYIATNCTPTRTKLEFFNNECATPDVRLGIYATPEVIPQLGAGNVPVTFTSPVSGRSLAVYCLRWKFARGLVSLTGGQNYWVSAYLDGTGVVTEEAYVLYRGTDNCPIKITQAQFLSTPFEISEWATIDQVEPVARDLAFRILAVVTSDVQSATVTVVGQPNGTLIGGGEPLTAPSDAGDGPTGDVNHDGRVDHEDVEWILRQLGEAVAPAR